jgi:hypothetical protein
MRDRLKAEEAEKDRSIDAATQQAASSGAAKSPVWELNTSEATSLKTGNEDRVSLSSGEK